MRNIQAVVYTNFQQDKYIMDYSIFSTYLWLLPLIIVISLFDAVMKSIALWKSARNNHLVWFVCLLVFNTVGILPIIYIILDKNGGLNSTTQDNE